MRNPLLVAAATAVLLGPTPNARAQVTRDDYAKADALRAGARDAAFKLHVRPHWFADVAPTGVLNVRWIGPLWPE